VSKSSQKSLKVPQGAMHNCCNSTDADRLVTITRPISTNELGVYSRSRWKMLIYTTLLCGWRMPSSF